MAASDSLLPLLACPRCARTPLDGSADKFACGGCGTEFPSLDGIPWLFAEPTAALGEWRERLHFVLRRLDQDLERLATEARQPELHALTKRRLEHLSEAYRDHSRRLREILAPLQIEQLKASYEVYVALRTRLPSSQGLTTYYANAHRDWCWGEQENRASFELVAEALGSSPLAKVLVLGAGASRLAYDVHQNCAPELTVACDFNPLLLLLAQRVVRGEPVALYEFPIAPKSGDDQAVLRRLAAEAQVRDGFHFVLGDALQAPFAAGAFDAVITPWLIDIVSEDLPQFAGRINRLLKTGGSWINFGSLTFSGPSHARCYGLEEVLALVETAGFSPPAPRQDTIPYMCSPASRHGRREEVTTWSAVKRQALGELPCHQALPDWVIKGEDSVPLLPAFQLEAVTTRIHAFILSLIDGQRSIRDMVELVAERQLMTVAEAEPAIRSFLIRLYETSSESHQR